MPHQELLAEPKLNRRKPENIQAAIDEDGKYQLEFWALSKKKPHFFDAANNEDALRHVAEYLQIDYPLVFAVFRAKAWAVHSKIEGIIYPPRS